MGFPKERGNFLQEKCFFLQKMHFPAEKMHFSGGLMAGNRRKPREGFRAQESRTLANFHKNISGTTYMEGVTMTPDPNTSAKGIEIQMGAVS